MIADGEDLDIRERLRLFLESIMEGAVRWPGISRAHLYDPFINGNSDTLFLNRLNDFLDALLGKFSGTDFGSEQAIRMALLQIVSAVMLPGMVPGVFPALSGGKVQEEKWQKEYVDELLKRYF